MRQISKSLLRPGARCRHIFGDPVAHADVPMCASFRSIADAAEAVGDHGEPSRGGRLGEGEVEAFRSRGRRVDRQHRTGVGRGEEEMSLEVVGSVPARHRDAYVLFEK